MTFKPLKQTDLRWKYLLLKPSNLTIGGYGCLLTDCSMAAGTTPDIAVNKVNFTESGMLIWESLIKIGLKLIKRERNKWDNQAVLDAIDKYGFCLGELVHPSGIIHWVLLIGDKKMIDPLSGKVEPTSKYSHYIGSCILQNIKQEETMSDALKECLAQHTILVTEAGVKDKQIAAQKGLVTKEEKKAHDCNIELGNAKLRIAELEKAKPIEAIKDPMRYVVSLLIGALLTWAYSQFPLLGQINPDMQGLAVVLVGLVIKGLDKYQHESGSRLKLPF